MTEKEAGSSLQAILLLQTGVTLISLSLFLSVSHHSSSSMSCLLCAAWDHFGKESGKPEAFVDASS